MTERPEPVLLQPSDRAGIERYLLDRALIREQGVPIAVATAGAGNMNLALRVTPVTGPSLIVKQGRPWVEKYKHIPAPFERTLVEAAFYAAVQHDAAVASRMPAILHLDRENHVLVLEDVGAAGDLTRIYSDQTMPATTVTVLLDWLEHLALVDVPTEDRAILANRAMRTLNHEHMFRFPLNAANGLDLDAITSGLRPLADDLTSDRAYCEMVTVVGEQYLADGITLVHGDFFPGSWLNSADGVRVIDPEFGFLGPPEFDCGILAAHLLIAHCDSGLLDTIQAAAERRRLDLALIARFAGVEIMRRLIGVAQLPLTDGLDRKSTLLRHSRRLVLEPDQGLA